MSFDIKNNDVNIPESEIRKIIEIVLAGGTGADVYRAGIKTSKGEPVSERQARRYKNEVSKLIEELPEEILDNFRRGEYMADEVFGVDEETAYPPVIVPQQHLKSCVVDLEVLSPAFNLMGKYSHLLICASFLPMDTREPYTLELTFEDKNDDRRLLREVINELSKYDFVIGHNVKGYDINWLMTRIMFYGWDMPDIRLFYFDTYSSLRRVPLLHRKSLGHAIDFFRIEDAEKTNVMPVSWDRIRSPHQQDFNKAMEEIVYHCENDVVANGTLFDILWHKRYDPKPKWTLWPR